MGSTDWDKVHERWGDLLVRGRLYFYGLFVLAYSWAVYSDILNYQRGIPDPIPLLVLDWVGRFAMVGLFEWGIRSHIKRKAERRERQNG